MWFLIPWATFLFLLLTATADAHRSGCHRWHTCPSDHGTYGTVTPSTSPPDTAPQRTPTPPPQSTSQHERFSGKVVDIQTGGTLGVLRNSKMVQVRLYGIDMPEPTLPLGQQTRTLLRKLVLRQQVTVTIREIDPNGQMVGTVQLADGRDLGQTLLQADLARDPAYSWPAVHASSPPTVAQTLATQELEAWRQEWFAYERELREWCMKQRPPRLAACMEEQSQQYGVTSLFFSNLHKGIIRDVGQRPTAPGR